MKAKAESIYTSTAVKLATNQLPAFSIDRHNGYVKYGPENNYPEYLLFLLNNHSDHGAIVKGKAKYISGTKIKSANPAAEAFLLKANPEESWYQVYEKIKLDKVTFGGYYLRVETNALGQPICWYHMPYCFVRRSKDGECFKVSRNWTDRALVPTSYPEFKSGHVGTSLYFYKTYTPAATRLQETYPQPEYLSCTLDIDTDIRISTFSNNLIRNNFSAGQMITIFSGETDSTKKKNIADRITSNHEGEDNAGKTVVAFAQKDGKGAEVVSLNTNDLDKQYDTIWNRNQQKILTGHNVNGVLFKIKTEGQLGTSTEIIENHELFINEYAKVEQVHFNTQLAYWCKLKTGIVAEFTVEQVQPIGLELPLDNANVVQALNQKDPNIILNYLIKKYGLDVPIAEIAPPGSPAIQPVKQTEVNQNIKGLSAKEHAQLERIIRQFNKGKLTKEAASMLLRTGLGISEADANTLLGVSQPAVVQQSSHDKNKKFFELFVKYAHDISPDDEVIEVQAIQMASDAIRIELKDDFVDPNDASKGDLRNAILNQLKGNPTLSKDQLAKNLKVDVSKITDELTWLKENEYVQPDFTPTQKGINKSTEPLDTEVYTEYTYGLRPDVEGPVVKNTTRDFCREMVQMTKNKALSFEAIDKLTNEFGENAFDFRGGWYNDGTHTTPWCRHIWLAHTKIRKVKK